MLLCVRRYWSVCHPGMSLLKRPSMYVDEKAEPSEESSFDSRTGDEMSSGWALVDTHQSGEKEANGDNDFIFLNGRKVDKENEVPSMAQYAMEDLREDLNELRLQIAESDAKKKKASVEKPKPSAN